MWAATLRCIPRGDKDLTKNLAWWLERTLPSAEPQELQVVQLVGPTSQYNKSTAPPSVGYNRGGGVIHVESPQ